MNTKKVSETDKNENMQDFLSEIEEEEFVPSENALSRMAELAALQIKLEGEVDRVTAELKVAKEKLEKVCSVSLPEAMKEVRMESFKLVTGETIVVKEDLTISVPKKRREEVIKKLRDMGHDGLIKNSVEIEFDVGQDNLAGDVLGHADELGLLAVRTENVNSGSLKKLLKERMEDGIVDDLAFFGAFLLRRTKIKQ